MSLRNSITRGNESNIYEYHYLEVIEVFVNKTQGVSGAPKGHGGNPCAATLLFLDKDITYG